MGGEQCHPWGEILVIHLGLTVTPSTQLREGRSHLQEWGIHCLHGDNRSHWKILPGVRLWPSFGNGRAAQFSRPFRCRSTMWVGGGRKEAELTHPTGTRLHWMWLPSFIRLRRPYQHGVRHSKCTTMEPRVGCSYKVKNQLKKKKIYIYVRIIYI